MQWYSEMSFAVGKWWSAHLQISSQPGRLIQTQEACWGAGMRDAEREEGDRQVADRWGGWVHDNDRQTEIVSICMYEV